MQPSTSLESKIDSRFQRQPFLEFDTFIRDYYNGHVYRLLFTNQARKQYESLGGRLKSQVDKGLGRISKNPHLGKPLVGDLKGIWSERVATFRILYKIYQKEVEVLVLLIEHRKKVYGGH